MLETILRQQPEDGSTLFVDMNSFFASCEQQANPALRDRPIGVCPFISRSTCVIAASIEAKRFGVKTAMRVPQAQQLCPSIELVQANPPLYREYHRQLMAQLDNTRCRVGVKSIDEAVLHVPRDLRDQPRLLAAEVKQRVRSVGDHLQCSVGIAPNLFLAKMGSNAQKPNGLVEIKLDSLAEFYQTLQLTDLYGISWRMAKRLKDLGIFTPLEFYQAPFSLLKRAFGVNGESWYLRLRGYEVDTKPTHRGSIGHQMTITPKPASNREEVLSVASQLTYRSAIRLRSANLAARGVVFYVRFDDRSWWGKVYHGRQAFFDSASFFAHVKRLFSFCRMPKPVRLVSVTAIDLLPQDRIPARLFDTVDKEERLSQALDDINWRYGEASVMTGRQMLTGKIRDAIGFGNSAQNAMELPVK